MNRYLMDRAMRRGSGRGMDRRNPYGSRGGYVVDRGMSGMDYRGNRGGEYGDRYGYDPYSQREMERYPNEYEQPRDNNRPMQFYGRGEMYGNIDGHYKGGDYEEKEMEEEYKRDLEKWIEELKKKDRFKISLEQAVQTARNMGVRFDGFNEMEFYAALLMMISDHKTLSNDTKVYFTLAKDFFEDDDIAVSPSEKLCKYMYGIVYGE